MQAQIIQKEDLSQVKFSNELVLDDQDRNDLMQKLKRSETLGNGFKNKCKIFFNAISGPKVVETTIWMVSNDFINLKGGQTIPVNCISKVEF